MQSNFEEIDPVQLEENISQYLLAVKEKKLGWTKGGICSGFAFLAFRSEIHNKSAEYQKHLLDLSKETSDSIKKLGDIVLEYHSLLEKYSHIPSHQKKFKVALAKFDVTKDQHQIANCRKAFFNKIRNQVLKKIANKKLLKKSLEYYNFIHMLLAAYYPGRYVQLQNDHDRHVRQEDFLEILKLLPINAPMPPVTQVFNFAFNFSQKELARFFNQVLREGDHVELTSTDHAVYLGVKKDHYILYDPTPIIIAPKSNKTLARIIKQQFYTDYNVKTDYMPTAIHIYSDNQEIKRPAPEMLFKKLIDKRGKNPRLNQKASNGATALYMAAYDNCQPIVNILTKAGADVNSCDNDSYTPISIAALCDNMEAIKILVEHHADVNHINPDKNSPLHFAAKFGHRQTVQTLLEAKANVNLRNKKDETPLVLAIRRAHWGTASSIYSVMDKKTVAPDLRMLRKELKMSYQEMEAKLNPNQFFVLKKQKTSKTSFQSLSLK